MFPGLDKHFMARHVRAQGVSNRDPSSQHQDRYLAQPRPATVHRRSQVERPNPLRLHPLEAATRGAKAGGTRRSRSPVALTGGRHVQPSDAFRRGCPRASPHPAEPPRRGGPGARGGTGGRARGASSRSPGCAAWHHAGGRPASPRQAAEGACPGCRSGRRTGGPGASSARGGDSPSR